MAESNGQSIADRLLNAKTQIQEKLESLKNQEAPSYEIQGRIFKKILEEEQSKQLANQIIFKGPRCTLPKDARSAVDRAKSDTCKQEISDITCAYIEDNNFSISTEVFHTSYRNSSAVILPTKVNYGCDTSPKKYKPSSAVETYSQKHIDDLDPVKDSNILKFDPQNPLRICYHLILHGRSLRQVKRLFKAVYTEHDYYIIHVDRRSLYLYHSLVELLEPFAFPNVAFQRNRFTPIWGGTSLLTTIKDAQRQALEQFRDWDYFINLSFADFPINHREKLRLYLLINNGKSFCKSHGRETEKFVRKQGLNKVFYECENRMWRLHHRGMPENLQINGGSDWFALHRSLCEYANSDANDGVLKELNVWYNYTLLPAESYFHTLLQTSEYCHNYVDNNLRVTNWNRARGCKLEKLFFI